MVDDLVEKLRELRPEPCWDCAEEPCPKCCGGVSPSGSCGCDCHTDWAGEAADAIERLRKRVWYLEFDMYEPNPYD